MFEKSSKNGNQILNRSSENRYKVTKIYNVLTVLSVPRHLYVSSFIKTTRKNEKSHHKTMYFCKFAWVKRVKDLYRKMPIFTNKTLAKHTAYRRISVYLYEKSYSGKQSTKLNTSFLNFWSRETRSKAMRQRRVTRRMEMTRLTRMTKMTRLTRLSRMARMTRMMRRTEMTRVMRWTRMTRRTNVTNRSKAMRQTRVTERMKEEHKLMIKLLNDKPFHKIPLYVLLVIFHKLGMYVLLLKFHKLMKYINSC